MLKDSKLYKVLGVDGSAFHGGSGKWHLPQNGEPGEWMPTVEGELIPCKNGYHLCRAQDILPWLGPAIYEVETRGDLLYHQDKVVVRQARLIRRMNWDEHVAQLFACDCTNRVLPLFEREYPDDDRPRRALEVTRRYVDGDGKATNEELVVARDAAWDSTRAVVGTVARDVAWAAAWTATRAAAWDSTRAAVGAVARAAAWAAAEAAAREADWEAAWNDEKEWQIKRVTELIQPKGK